MAANPYTGVFLSNLAVFIREIDPELAAEAEGVVRAEQREAAAAAAEGKTGGGGAPGAPGGVGAAANAGKGGGGSSGGGVVGGGFEGSVEETLSYCAAAAGTWMDFLDRGVDDWVASRLAELGASDSGGGEGGEEREGEEGKGENEEGPGSIEWPPRRCCQTSSRFLEAFVRAAEIAEAEDDEKADDGEEEDDDDEEDGSGD